MAIHVNDLDKIDFSDVADTHLGKMRPIHPGEILREEFLAPLGMSVNALAIALHVPSTRLHEIVKERRGITTDTALRLARYFNMSAQFWLGLQTAYELRLAKQNLLPTIEREVLPREVA
ncbi:HigA family addiction module antitoxin [Crenothrix polyspora]|uniref:Virulence-associated protein I n=1 Tax=Crenothrix polyspora TaxID=360316 RepID=A0A1R4HFJ4_9GAMM|nr:HigA family addiction module antitoxin [Crenothrix polyspora]SJM94982.1 Virulence-associated protein I [Crenothrix polyspora]